MRWCWSMAASSAGLDLGMPVSAAGTVFDMVKNSRFLYNSQILCYTIIWTSIRI